MFLAGPETERLTHRAKTEADAAAFYALNSNSDVMKFTGDVGFESEEQAAQAIRDYPDFERYGFGRWGCYLKATGQLIGFSGLKYLPDLDEVDLGYRFFPEFWGQGIATESALACVEFAFRSLELTSVIGLVLPEDVASIRVLEKSGFQADGEIEPDGMRVLRFRVTAEV